MSFRAPEGNSLREPITTAARIRLAGFEYDSGADEYTFSTIPSNAGFEDQGGGEFLLTTDPAGSTATVYRVGENALVMT